MSSAARQSNGAAKVTVSRPPYPAANTTPSLPLDRVVSEAVPPSLRAMVYPG